MRNEKIAILSVIILLISGCANAPKHDISLPSLHRYMLDPIGYLDEVKRNTQAIDPSFSEKWSEDKYIHAYKIRANNDDFYDIVSDIGYWCSRKAEYGLLPFQLRSYEKPIHYSKDYVEKDLGLDYRLLSYANLEPTYKPFQEFESLLEAASESLEPYAQGDALSKPRSIICLDANESRPKVNFLATIRYKKISSTMSDFYLAINTNGKVLSYLISSSVRTAIKWNALKAKHNDYVRSYFYKGAVYGLPASIKLSRVNPRSDNYKLEFELENNSKTPFRVSLEHLTSVLDSQGREFSLVFDVIDGKPNVGTRNCSHITNQPGFGQILVNPDQKCSYVVSAEIIGIRGVQGDLRLALGQETHTLSARTRLREICPDSCFD